MIHATNVSAKGPNAAMIARRGNGNKTAQSGASMHSSRSYLGVTDRNDNWMDYRKEGAEVMKIKEQVLRIVEEHFEKCEFVSAILHQDCIPNGVSKGYMKYQLGQDIEIHIKFKTTEKDTLKQELVDFVTAISSGKRIRPNDDSSRPFGEVRDWLEIMSDENTYMHHNLKHYTTCQWEVEGSL